MAQICGKPFPFGPRIASDEQEERLAALAEITEWLKKQDVFTEMDGQKLWYVLRNGLWKTDMVLVQHDFCKKIAAMIEQLPQGFVKVFIETFFTGTAKEWGTIDKWRIEKFMVLVRYFVNEIFKWVKENNEYEFLEQLFVTILKLEIGIGIILHFIDVVVEPLMNLVKEDPKNNSKFLKPFCSSFVNSNTKTSVAFRIYEKIIEPIVQSDGEYIFGNDIDGSLHFLRGLLDITNKSLKTSTEVNQNVLQKRFDAANSIRASIKTILDAKKQIGEPAEKQI